MSTKQVRCVGYGSVDCPNWAVATYEVKLSHVVTIEPLCAVCVDSYVERGSLVKLVSREVMDR